MNGRAHATIPARVPTLTTLIAFLLSAGAARIAAAQAATAERLTLEATSVSVDHYEGPSCLEAYRFSVFGVAAFEDASAPQGSFGGTVDIGPTVPGDTTPDVIFQGVIRVGADEWLFVGEERNDWVQGDTSCEVVDGELRLAVSALVPAASVHNGTELGGGFDFWVDFAVTVGADWTVTSSSLSARSYALTDPVRVSLDPGIDSGEAGTTHSVTATVHSILNSAEEPAPGFDVQFAVDGPAPATGACTTDAAGRCSFTYTGPQAGGSDVITAFADTNGDGVRSFGEPSGTAEMSWTPPADVQPPTVVAPPDLQVSTAPGACGAAVASGALGTATATDNVGVVSLTHDAPALFPPGATVVTWTASDAAGNTARAWQTVTVVDREAPAVAAPPELEVVAESSSGATVSQAVLGSAAVSDNCAGSRVLSPSGIPAGHLFPVGVTVLEWTATDAAGNISRASQRVVVRYGICALYDQSKAAKSGSTVPLRLQLCTASGAPLDLPHVAVHATGLTQLSGSASGELLASGQANPDNDFRYDSDSRKYVFNLKTTGLAQGTWALQFMVDGQASSGYVVQFGVR